MINVPPKTHGSALVLTVLITAAMTTLVLAVAQLVPKDFRQIQALEASLQAEYAAWSGVEHALVLLRNAQARGQFLSLSAPLVRESGAASVIPYGGQVTDNRPGTIDCMLSANRAHEDCRTVDRELGYPRFTEPYSFYAQNPLATDGMEYKLAIWHRRQNVGNIHDLSDGLAGGFADDTSNINPVLVRDEVRRLDIVGTDRITLRWLPIHRAGTCETDDGGRTDIRVLVSVVDADGQIIHRAVQRHTPNTVANVLSDIPTSGGVVLSLRFIVTNSQSGNPSEDEPQIRDCAIRYSLDASGDTSAENPNRTADLGYDVVDSVGESGGVRRKIRILVHRENGRLLNIFDFGIACEACEVR